MNPSDMPKGVAIGFLTYGVYACCDAGIKAMGGAIPTFQIMFTVMAFSVVPIYFARPAHERWRDSWRMKRPGLVLVRALSGTLAGIFGVVAFTTLPLAEAYALIFLMPFFVTVLSVAVLKETIGWRRWGAVMFGLVGVLLVIRPGFREILPGHFAAVAVAFCAALMVLVLRVLGRTEQRVTLLSAVVISALLVNGVLMIPSFTVPTAEQLAIMAFSGFCAGLGHIGLMAATRLAPANRVAPTQYSQIVWAIVLGAVFFNEIPDMIAIAGMTVVVASGLFTFLREEKVSGWSRRTPVMRERP